MKRLRAASCLVMLTAACTTVGPDYRGPPVAAPRAEAGASFVNAGADVPASPPLAAWWRALGDPLLDRLVADAREANKDVAVARARLRQARALLRAAGADALPQGSTRAAVTRTKPSVAGLGIDPGDFPVSAVTLYEAALDASWEIDLFGSQRRAREAAGADLAAAGLSLGDVQLSVTAETVLAYVALRDAQARLALAGRNRSAALGLVRIAGRARAAGAASGVELARAQGSADAAVADGASIQADVAAALARVAVLTGREPGTLDALLSPPAPLPDAPALVAVGDPASTLRRRPDVRAAERRIAAETARIGVAVSDLFPKISLTGTVGLSTTMLDSLGSEALTYGVGPQLRWNLLDFGRVRARIEQARGVRDERLADYEGTVLAALRDAETALARHRRSVEEARARDAALLQADRTVALARLRRSAGEGTLEELITAERERIAVTQAAEVAHCRVLEGYVQRMKALGAGWGRE